MREGLDFIHIDLPVTVLVDCREDSADSLLDLVLGQRSVTIRVQKRQYKSHPGAAHHARTMISDHSMLTGRAASAVPLPAVSMTGSFLLTVVTLLLPIVTFVRAPILLHSLLDGLLNHLANHFMRRPTRLSAHIRQLPSSGLLGRRGWCRCSVRLGERREGREHQSGGRGGRAAWKSHDMLHWLVVVCLKLIGWPPTWSSFRLFLPGDRVTMKLHDHGVWASTYCADSSRTSWPRAVNSRPTMQ